MVNVEESTCLDQKLLQLSTLLEEKPESFVYGSSDVQSAALHATKYVFDLSVATETLSRPHIEDLISSISHSNAPQTRSQAQALVQERSDRLPPVFQLTPLSSLFVEGMNEEQIWAQLELKMKNVCHLLELVLEGEAAEDEEEASSNEDADDNLREALKALESDEKFDLGDFLGDPESQMSSEESDNSVEEEDSDGEGSHIDSEELGEAITTLRDEFSDEGHSIESFTPTLSSATRTSSAKTRRKMHGGSELDDEFFTLEDFNAETERAEAQSSTGGHLGDDPESDKDMPVDLFAPVNQDNFDENDLEDEAEAFYQDFFDPPPKSHPIKKPSNMTPKSGKVRFHDEVRVKRIKGRNVSLHALAFGNDKDGDEDEDFAHGGHDDTDEEGTEASEMDLSEMGSDSEMPRATIERLKDDLFAEDDDSRKTSDGLSTHEKRMSALRQEIAELEKENVAQKEWVLMGEAGSRSRPQNSALEEDLEFERVMKAVPVITEDTVQVLEERIKARIMEGRFDDVVRIRPLDDKPFLPSRFFELQDTKSAQSLAQIYENEYIATQSGGPAIDDRDGRLLKEHNEIEEAWERICGKLDALCNARFVPKQPKATISTVSNVSTASLESAIPTTKSVATMLAPEEVYRPASSDSRARSELTPAEKRALRAKERKAKKKDRDALDRSVDKFAKTKSIGGIKKQKKAALKSIVKTGKGVTVMGKTMKKSQNKRDQEIKS